MPCRRIALVFLTLSLGALTARAQDQASQVFTLEDREVDDALDRASALVKAGSYSQAGEEYAKLELLLEKKREKDPDARIVSRVGPGLDRGVVQVVRDRVRALPEDGLATYRTLVDPKARLAYDAAVEERDLEALESISERYALSTSAKKALVLLGSLSLERGDLPRAERVYARLEREVDPVADKEEARRYAYFRLVACVARGDAGAAADALASFEARGGDSSQARLPMNGKLVSPRDAVDAARSLASKRPDPAAVDPARLSRFLFLENPELPVELAERLERVGGVVPAYQQPVFDPETRLLIVADEKTVRGVDIDGRGLGWQFTFGSSEPGRLEVATCQPALGPGRIYATLHLNRPAQRVLRGAGPAVGPAPRKPGPKPPKKPQPPKKDPKDKSDDEDEIVRLPDWRIVAIDRKTGRLIWDAAEADKAHFDDVAREAEWVSSPCESDGQVFVSVLMRKGSDLRAYLVSLDGASGKVRFRAFLGSRLPYDFLGLGSPPAAPAVKDGKVYVTTSLGVIACVEPARGEVLWLSRYPSVPERSQPEVVRNERRFRATPPLVHGKLVVVAPSDAEEIFALDPATGARRWSVPRGEARVLSETRSGNLLVVSDRVVGYERGSGAARFLGEPLGGHVVAPAISFEKEALVPLESALVRVSLEDGKVLGRFRYEQPTFEAGALATAGEGRVATASWRRANVYEDLSLLASAEKALPRGAAELLRGESNANRGDAAEAQAHLERAIVETSLSNDERTHARRLAFAVLAEQATRAREKGDRAGFLAAAKKALEHADAVLNDAARGGRALDLVPNDLLTRTATLRRVYADVLAESKDEADTRHAIDEYERLLRMPPGTLLVIPGAADARGATYQVEARAFGRMKVRELVKARGRECYALQDRSAAEHMKDAEATGTKEGYEKVLRLYPASSHAAEARFELHRFYVQRALESEAAQVLEQFLVEEPDSELVPEVLARLAVLDESMHRPARARRAAQALLAAAGDTTVVHGRDGLPPVLARAFAGAVLARNGSGDPDAIWRQDATADLEAPLRRVFRSTTELSAAGGELVEGHNVGLAPRNVYLLRRGALLEARSNETGIVLGNFDAPSSLLPDRRWLGWSGGCLVIASATKIMGYDQKTFAPKWQVSLTPPLGRPAISPDDFTAVELGDSVVLALTKWNEAVAFDAATGKTLWNRPLTGRDAGGGILTRGSLGVLVGDAPARVEGVDLATGTTVWTFKPEGVRPGVVARVSGAHWAGDGLAVEIDSRRIHLVDRKDGTTLWQAGSGELGWFGPDMQPSPDGSALLVRGVGGGPAFWVFDARNGKELWHDDFYGAVLPGPRPEADGVLPLLEEIVVGENAVYTFRQRGGSAEVWSQDLRNGTRTWVWEAHGARGPTTLIETPTACLVARDGRFDRASLVVIGKGTGVTIEQLPLPGRKMIGRGIVAVGGVVVCSTDRGTFGLARVDDDQLARETLDATLALAKHDTAPGRAALADKLARAQPPRIEEAIDACSKALLAEGTGSDPEHYDRLFAQLASLSEASVESVRPAYDVRRMPRPPEIDGELNDWWRAWSSIDLTGPRYVSPIQLEGGRPGRWTGPEDLSAQLYMGWDEKYFYFTLDVMDSDLRPYDSESTKWIGDCLLIAIDTKNDGGFWFAPDDVLLSLALTLPKKKKDEDKDKKDKDKDKEDEDKDKHPEGKYFVKRKDDGSGAIYEAQIPWSIFITNGATGVDAVKGPPPGFTFGFNIVLTDDDGDRIGPEDLPPGVDPATLPEGKRLGDFRGALKTLQLTPSVLLHEKKDRLWQGYIPEYFAKITVR